MIQVNCLIFFCFWRSVVPSYKRDQRSRPTYKYFRVYDRLKQFKGTTNMGQKKITPQPGFVGRRSDMIQPVISHEPSFKRRCGDMPMLELIDIQSYTTPIIKVKNKCIFSETFSNILYLRNSEHCFLYLHYFWVHQKYFK